ncbi:MAG TPA: Gfo/Idh/MocA family oxidoreductase [Tepidisphaeraceae bacterium]|jgi:predicted dehydrogenase
MAQPIRLAVAGIGASGRAHAQAAAAGGFKLVGVADPIPDRLATVAGPLNVPLAADDVEQLISDPSVDALCICLPTHLHLPVATAALKAGKHVMIELPPTPTARDAKALARAADKAGRVLLYSAVRRFGGAEQSARQAIEKGHVGPVYHARLTALRTRGVPQGTGWYHDPQKTGGGAVVDLALPLIDLLLYLIAPAVPKTVFAVAHYKLTGLSVEESASLLIKFDNNASAEISCAWAMNQPPSQAGTICRLAGEHGAVDVYTPQGPIVYRAFDAKGQAKATLLKQPKTVGHPALLRHFRSAILGETPPAPGPAEGVALMTLAEAIYKSVATGRAVEVA